MAPRVSGYELELSVRLRKVEWDPDCPDVKLWMNESLSVDDRRTLGALDFAQVAQVLARFYDTAEALKAEFTPSAEKCVAGDAAVDRCEIANIVAAGCTIDDVIRDWPQLAARFIRATLSDSL